MSGIDFKVGDAVKFVKTSSKELDSLTGVVVNDNDVSPYPTGRMIIVLLDSDKTYFNQRAVRISQHCLEKI